MAEVAGEACVVAAVAAGNIRERGAVRPSTVRAAAMAGITAGRRAAIWPGFNMTPLAIRRRAGRNGIHPSIGAAVGMADGAAREGRRPGYAVMDRAGVPAGQEWDGVRRHAASSART